MEKNDETDGAMHNEDYIKHLEWLKPAWTQEDCLELDEFDFDNEYNIAAREGAGTQRDYTPVFDRVVCFSFEPEFHTSFVYLWQPLSLPACPGHGAPSKH